MAGYPSETPEAYEDTHEFIVRDFKGRYAITPFQLVDETSFQKVRERWGQLRSGDEMTFRVFRAGRVIDLKGRLP